MASSFKPVIIVNARIKTEEEGSLRERSSEVVLTANQGNDEDNKDRRVRNENLDQLAR